MQTHTIDTRKPAFRWLGFGDKADNNSSAQSVPVESRKRAFGMDLTNTDLKRSKVDSLMGFSKDFEKQKQRKQETCTHEVDNTLLDKDSNDNPKSYQFGPFAPVTLAQSGPTNNNQRRVRDWDNITSNYYPQYQNQGIEIRNHKKKKKIKVLVEMFR